VPVIRVARKKAWLGYPSPGLFRCGSFQQNQTLKLDGVAGLAACEKLRQIEPLFGRYEPPIC